VFRWTVRSPGKGILSHHPPFLSLAVQVPWS
jgi:hypothetical protein